MRLEQSSATALDVQLESASGQVQFSADLVNGSIVTDLLVGSRYRQRSAPGNSTPATAHRATAHRATRRRAVATTTTVATTTAAVTTTPVATTTGATTTVDQEVAPTTTERRQRLRKRSIRRRSFFVGRPVPGSRRNNGATYSRAGGGGLWSTTHSAAIGALTRRSIGWTTSRIRCRSESRTSTRSPTRMGCAGLAGRSLILTCPPLHAAVANERVLNTRTAHSH